MAVGGRAGSMFLWDSRTVHAVRLHCILYDQGSGSEASKHHSAF